MYNTKGLRKVLSIILTLSMVIGMMPAVNIFAADTGKKIDVWDFGAFQQSGDLYRNNITSDVVDALATTHSLGVDGKFPAAPSPDSIDFGDVSVKGMDKSERIYYCAADGSSKGTYSAGTFKSNQFSDGYIGKGYFYFNGAGSDTSRYFEMRNVKAGDKIVVYGFIDNTTSAVIHFDYQGTAEGEGETVQLASAKIGTPFRYEVVAENTGTYKIWFTCGGKIRLHRMTRTPGVTVSGKVANTSSSDISATSITFFNQTTEQFFPAQFDGENYTANLAPGYSYVAILRGIKGVGFTDAGRIITLQESDIATDKPDTALTVENKVLYTISGSVEGIASDYNIDNLIIRFVPPVGAASIKEIAVLDKTKLTYSAELDPNIEYTVDIGGINDYYIKEGATVNLTGDKTQNIVLETKPLYSVSGDFIDIEQNKMSAVQGINSVTFTNIEDEYVYTGELTENGYSVSLRDGVYQISVDSNTHRTLTTVTVAGAALVKDIMLAEIKPTAPNTPTSHDLYVGYPDKENNYETVQKAVNAAATLSPASESDRITIHIAPGLYREQVVIQTPYITFVNDEPQNGEAKITWYYGVEYVYYSARTAKNTTGEKGYYDPELAYNKSEKAAVENWGSTVAIRKEATNFKAKDIVFENSFNKYVTEEEIADGVEPQEGTSHPTRRLGSSVTDSNYKERAAAMLVKADFAEFSDCSFLGSQDTLYTGDNGFKSYYKNCFIEGGTDYIFGEGDVIFDNCELRWSGATDKDISGQVLTAAKNSNYSTASGTDGGVTKGYLFRNCSITSDPNSSWSSSGLLSRPWGAGARVAFLNTKLSSANVVDAAGWTEMSGVKPSQANFYEYGTTFNGELVDTSKRASTLLSGTAKPEDFVPTDFFGASWQPTFYTESSGSAPTFKTVPYLISNNDTNLIYGNDILTVNYEFENANDNANDSSLIKWYRVAADGKEELVKTNASYISKSYKVTDSDFGYFLKAVVVPENVEGNKGKETEIKTIVPVSEGWSGDPDIGGGNGKVKVYIAGDSTVKTYGITNETAGWGEYLQAFFDKDQVSVLNYSNGGRSTRNFINEGSLDTIKAKIKKGDYLFIQFGHNDAANDSGNIYDRYVPLGQPDANGKFPVDEGTIVEDTTQKYPDGMYTYNSGGTYKWFLLQYINAAREVGAIPVLCTPVSRLYYESGGTGKIRPHHDATNTSDTYEKTYISNNNSYVTAVKQIAKEENVLLIDMFELTKNIYENAWKDDSQASGQSSPLVSKIFQSSDSTHTNKIGGFYLSALIANAVKQMDISIKDAVVAPSNVYGIYEGSPDYFALDASGEFTAYEPTTTTVSTYWSEAINDYLKNLGNNQGGSDEPDEPDEPVIGGTPGDFNGDDELSIDDASSVLAYVLNSSDEVFKDYTSNQFNFADVDGDSLLTARDVSEILLKVLNGDKFEFSRKDFPTVEKTTSEETSVETTTAVTTEATTTEATTTEATTTEATTTEATTTEATTTEATTTEATTTEATTEGTTNEQPDANAEFNDTSDFSGWKIEYNRQDVGIELDNVENIMGNATEKIHLPDKAVFKNFENPLNSGKAIFSVDMLTDNVAVAGRSFRIFLESNATPYDETGYATEVFNDTNIFYHLMDAVATSVVKIDDAKANASTAASNLATIGTLEANKWYRVVIEMDFDNKVATTSIYLHGTDGTYNPEAVSETPIGTVTESFIDKTPMQLKQIRLLRTAAGNVYFDNIKVEAVK